MNYDIVILGSGESGTGAALLAMQKGFKVFVSDFNAIPLHFKSELEKANIPFEEKQHSHEIILSAKEIIKSPGISDKVAIVKEIKNKNIPIISEIEFAFRYKNESKIIAITGTNGKTTTTSLTFAILKHAAYDVSMVGNIGYSFARQIALQPTAWYVMEISSFQLDDIITFRPDIAVILNITPDHLDRYEYKMENYIQAKFNIASNQNNDDYLIVYNDDEHIKNYILTHTLKPKIQYFTMQETVQKNGAYLSENEMVFVQNGERVSISINDISLNGKHNQCNSMAAVISSRLAEVRADKIRESLQAFTSLPHRMEFIASIGGIDFINDSKATNLNSVWFALESMKKTTVLILGGVDKGNDYNEILDLVNQKVKAIVALGKDTKIIQDFFRKYVPVLEADSMAEAVKLSYELGSKGDCVLLSPACASFDLFKNYEDRGDQFREEVKKL